MLLQQLRILINDLLCNKGPHTNLISSSLTPLLALWQTL